MSIYATQCDLFLLNKEKTKTLNSIKFYEKSSDVLLTSAVALLTISVISLFFSNIVFTGISFGVFLGCLSLGLISSGKIAHKYISLAKIERQIAKSETLTTMKKMLRK